MAGRLDGQVAVVTGASRGLGAASAEWLAGQGAHVVAVARTTGGLEAVDDQVQASGGRMTLAPMDVTDEGAMAHLCRSVHDRWGRADIWVHAAIHVTALTPTPQITPADLDQVLATDVRATARLIALMAPLLEPAEAPRAVFFDDADPPVYAGAYAMAKAAQRALVSAWQAETLRLGPAVHLLRPAPMATAVRARFHPGEDRASLADPRAEAARLLAPLFDG